MNYFKKIIAQNQDIFFIILRIESGEIMDTGQGVRISPDAYEIDVALQLTFEDDFVYFARFDDLDVFRNIMDFPAIANSCYIHREEVFGGIF